MSYPYVYLDSSFVGPYYKICCDLGLPQVDVQKFSDGSWALIEMMNAPVVPSLTKWNYIAKGLKNCEINHSRIKRIIDEIDPRKQWLWDKEKRKSDAIEQQAKDREDFYEERVSEVVKDAARNPDLQERIAKHGIQEILPHNIAKNLSDTKLRNA